MIITWKQGATELSYNGKTIPCSCNVRNEINGQRGMNEVVRTMPNGEPYMPRIFPKGMWKVGIPVPRESPELSPYFIPTDAYQMVPIWNVENGNYVSASKVLDRDSSYGMHFSEYKNTLGCIKIKVMKDLLDLVHEIRLCHKRNEDVYVTVS